MFMAVCSGSPRSIMVSVRFGGDVSIHAASSSVFISQLSVQFHQLLMVMVMVGIDWH